MSSPLDERPSDGTDQSLRHLDGSASTSMSASDGNKPLASGGDGEEAPHDRAWYLQQFRTAESQSVKFIDNQVRGSWVRSMKAYHNKHFDGSKYLTEQWRGRSKLFRPKTRIAVRKHLSNTAKALFGPGDVIAVTPQDEADEFQTASAAIKQELLNYRLSRQSKRNGIRWFQIVMGARQDSLIHGICISKQTWRYVEQVELDEFGQEKIDETTGEPKVRVLEDRPDCVLYPPENVLFSPTCDWTNPAQSTEVLILRHQMVPTEIRNMLKSGNRTGVKFDQLTMNEIKAARATGNSSSSQDTTGTRTARHDGADPLQNSDTIAPPIWVNEVFIRVDGRDMVFWVLGKNRVISEPIPTERAYPHVHGERPVVIGYGAIESHRPFPMSPVESWQQIQQEINDQVNLRNDHMKQVVTPLAKVKRGRQVDIKAVQSRGGNNGVLMLQDIDDVDWAQIPDLPQSAYVENNYLNADFDDAAGTFNSGSVQTNRSLNETVGGMKMLASDANVMGDFDLTIWVETWYEPVAWQLLKCCEYYETDAQVLALAGNKANLVQRFGVDEITDTLLMAETQLTVKVGIGVTNLPQERLQKFQMGAQIFGQVVEPFIAGGKNQMPSLKMKEVANTIFGDAGIPDAADRFFEGINDEPAPPQQPQPDPRILAEQEKLKIERERAHMEMQIEREKLAMEQAAHEAEMARDQQKFEMEQAWRERELAHKAQMEQLQVRINQQMSEAELQSRADIEREKLRNNHSLKSEEIRGNHENRQKELALNAHLAKAAAGGKEISLEDKPPPPDPMESVAPVLSQLAQAVQAALQQGHEMQQQMSQLMVMMSKPRTTKIVRDPQTGRASHAEHVFGE